MYLSFKDHTLELQNWESELDMMNFLKGCDAGNLVLGMDAETKAKFYSVVVNLEWARESAHHFGIGICSEGHGLVPHMLLQPLIGTLVFGFNSEVAGFNIYEKKVHFKIKLDTLFSSFISFEKWKIILIIHETGVVSINENGQVLWKYDSDVITDCVIVDENIHLKFMDAKSIALSVLNGKEGA
jgi:hypothetical protein